MGRLAPRRGRASDGLPLQPERSVSASLHCPPSRRRRGTGDRLCSSIYEKFLVFLKFVSHLILTYAGVWYDVPKGSGIRSRVPGAARRHFFENHRGADGRGVSAASRAQSGARTAPPRYARRRARAPAQVTRESGSRRLGRPAAGRTERKGTKCDEGRRFMPTVNDRNRYVRPVAPAPPFVTPARACPRPRAGKPGSCTAVAPDPAVAPALQRWQRSGKPRLDPGSGAGVTVVGAARPLLSRGQAGRGARGDGGAASAMSRCSTAPASALMPESATAYAPAACRS